MGRPSFFARAGSLQGLERLLAWAADAGVGQVGVVGSGSNLLVADAGVPGLVIKLDRALAKIEHRNGHLICGGGARLPQAAARAAALGLSGIEFGVNIPGTVGGAVRMNANAYGGELQRVLEWVDVCTGDGHGQAPARAARLRLPAAPTCGPGEVVARASFALEPGETEAIKRCSRTCAPAARPPSRRGSRLSARPSRTRTIREADGRTAGAAARGGGLPRARGRGRALLAQARELHRESRGPRDDGRRRWR